MGLQDQTGVLRWASFPSPINLRAHLPRHSPPPISRLEAEIYSVPSPLPRHLSPNLSLNEGIPYWEPTLCFPQRSLSSESRFYTSWNLGTPRLRSLARSQPKSSWILLSITKPASGLLLVDNPEAGPCSVLLVPDAHAMILATGSSAAPAWLRSVSELGSRPPGHRRSLHRFDF